MAKRIRGYHQKQKRAQIALVKSGKAKARNRFSTKTSKNAMFKKINRSR